MYALTVLSQQLLICVNTFAAHTPRMCKNFSDLNLPTPATQNARSGGVAVTPVLTPVLTPVFLSQPLRLKEDLRLIRSREQTLSTNAHERSSARRHINTILTPLLTQVFTTICPKSCVNVDI